MNDQNGKREPRVLLLDSNRWPVTARLTIALHRYGCAVAALCPEPRHPVRRVRTLRQSFVYSGFDPVGSIRKAVDQFQPDLLVPCCDRSVRHLHQLHANTQSTAMRALIEFSLGSPDGFAIVSSRHELLRIAAQKGIAVPRTVAIRSKQDLAAWNGKDAFPCLLKADGTWGGRGVRVAANIGDAEREWDRLARRPGRAKLLKQELLNRGRGWIYRDWSAPSCAVIAQELIAGRPANCAAFCWQGKVQAAVAVEVVSARSQMGPSTVVQIVEGREMLQAAECIASELRLSGFFGLDFMIENGSGINWLIEMNPRCTPVCPVPLGPGRDLPAALAAQLLGQSVPCEPAVNEKTRIAWFPQPAPATTQQNLPEDTWLDVPSEEPELIQELLDPWNERSVLGTIIDRFRGGRHGSQGTVGFISEAATHKPQAIVL